MKRVIMAVAACVVIAAIGVAHAGYVFEYMEGKECNVGGDVRARWIWADRDVNPAFAATGTMGPAEQWLRVRERVWMCFDINEATQLTLRLGNRWEHHSSSRMEPNNQEDVAWNFPDEVYIDNLYLDIANIMESDWSLRLGRQDVMVGNGMVLLEGTPFDDARTIYFDGAVATRKGDKDTLILMVLYNDYKDTAVFINDQNRTLRPGDTTVLGIHWTHNFGRSVNTDAYFLHTDIEDDNWLDDSAMPNTADVQLETIGARIYGAATDQISYSLEVARELGDLEPAGADIDAWMGDARITLAAAEGTAWSPALSFEYTYMSGDDPDSVDDFEGWIAAFASYPIWREELVPLLMSGQGWTNIHQYRTALALHLTDKVTLTGAWATIQADEKAMGTGVGDDVGHLLAGFLDIQVLENLSVALEAAEFWPGDYYVDGQTSEWMRVTTVYSF